ncbi:MAG: hypothetical protein WD847_08300 [Pirellulales bacterium]
MKRETFTLTLEAQPSKVPVAIRLRRALKILGRGYGLRCKAIRPASGGTDPAPRLGPSQAMAQITVGRAQESENSVPTYPDGLK